MIYRFYLILIVLEPDNANFPLLLAAYVVMVSGAATAGIFAPSILSDIIDYSRWKYNTDCTASFFSLYTLLNKANFALGGAIGFLVAGWYGFEPNVDSHSSESIIGLHLAVIWLPAVVALLSTVFIVLTPINARRQKTIRRYLDKKATRSDKVKDSLPVSEKLSTEILLSH